VAERHTHRLEVAEERHTHHPEEAAAAGIPRPQAEAAAVKGVGFPHSAVAAARPTFISSYALVGDVIRTSKPRAAISIRPRSMLD
jgi:hypothetical protein